MDGMGNELGAAVEKGEFDEERDADQIGTEFFEKFDGGGGGAAGGEKIVN